MSTCKVTDSLRRIYRAAKPDIEALTGLLRCEDPLEQEIIFDFADKVRKQHMGEGVLLRGLVEFSNHCDCECFYCGLNCSNSRLTRYALTEEEIMASVATLVSYRIKTVVLQSGEDSALDAHWLARIVSRIKERFSCAVTLSVGERSYNEYKMWKDAGADRYLLKIETTDAGLYESLHSGRRLATRLKCLAVLRELGYQVGSGNMIGLPGQTMEMICGDIVFFKQERFDMIGIGPFIPHPQTRLREEKRGDAAIALKALALTRIVTRDAHMPATTALGSLEEDFRFQALCAGANVLMPNFSPEQVKTLYQIYPGKRCVNEKGGACVACLEKKMRVTGRSIDYSIGHSLKQ